VHGEINADTRRRAAARTAEMAWTASPSGTVWRKRVHLVGPPESGQVTSVVRYEPGATFPAHDHPDGEEILVLEGVFSDERGDWPAGTYLLNPEGFRHAPRSGPGCLLFVKLRQYSGHDRRQVALGPAELKWRSEAGERSGVESALLYAQPGYPETTCLERWRPGTDLGRVEYPGGVEFFVLRGEWCDEEGTWPQGSWVRLPPGASHTPRSESGCVLYVKRGGVPALAGRPQPPPPAGSGARTDGRSE